MKLKHFIGTNYNVNLFSVKPEERVRLTPIQWMNHRFVIFRDFCYKGFADQTNKNFEWLIFVDDNTPDIYKKQLEDLSKGVFKIIYIPKASGNAPFPFSNHLTRARHDYIVENSKDAEYVITTRIDNDDFFEPDAIDEIQRFFAEHDYLPEKYAINFIYGHNVYVLKGKENKRKKRKWRFNPFLSMVEKNKNLLTVWCAKHHDMPRRVRVCEIARRVFWNRIVHEQNLTRR